jgi:hypothetical protein
MKRHCPTGVRDGLGDCAIEIELAAAQAISSAVKRMRTMVGAAKLGRAGGESNVRPVMTVIEMDKGDSLVGSGARRFDPLA